MSPESVPTDIIRSVAETGDPIDALKLEQIRDECKVFAAAACSVSTIYTIIEANPDVSDVTKILTASSLLMGGVITGAALTRLPHRNRRAVTERDNLQVGLEDYLAEPVEAFRYGDRHQPKTALYWRIVTEDQPTATERLHRMTTKLAESGQTMPDSLLVPIETHQAIWPHRDTETTSVNDFLRRQKHTTLRVKQDSQHVLVPFDEAMAVQPERIHDTTGVDYLLGAYSKLPISDATKELIANYQREPDVFGQRMRMAIFGAIQAGLSDTSYDRASLSKSNASGTLNTGTIMWIDNRGHFNGFQRLADQAGLNQPLNRADIDALIAQNPGRARQVVEAYLYLGLRDRQAVQHLAGAFVESETMALGSVHGAAIATYIDRHPEEQNLNVFNGTDLRRLSRTLGCAVLCATVAIGGMVLYQTESNRLNATGYSAMIANGVSLESTEPNAGIAYMADQGDPGAIVIDGINAISHAVLGFADEQLDRIGLADAAAPENPFEAYYNTFDLSQNATIGNVYSGAPNLAFWDIQANEGASADGYWINHVYNRFTTVGSGWFDSAQTMTREPIPLYDPATLEGVYGSLEISRTTAVQAYSGLALPVKAGTRLFGLEVRSAATDEIIPATAYLDSTGIPHIDIGERAEQVRIRYWLTERPANESHAAADLMFDNISQDDMKTILDRFDDRLTSFDNPDELASYIRHSYGYAVAPLDIDATSSTSVTEFLQAINASGKLNCNTAATLFAMAAYANQIDDVSYATGYLNGLGDDDSTISSREGHAFIIDQYGHIIDPTPNGPISAEDTAFFDEGVTKPEEPATPPDLIPISLGGLALGGLVGMGWYARRKLRQPAAERQMKRLSKANPATLGMAHTALNQSFVASDDLEIADRYELAWLDKLSKLGPRETDRETLKALRFDGRRLPRAVIRTALDLAAAPWSQQIR